MNEPAASPKVLVAPLDWGLGHATRCIPIIRELIAQNCTVVIGASGKVKALLEMEFPYLQYLALNGYDIKYSSSSWNLPFKIVAQIPKLVSAIKEEREWLKKIIKQEEIEIVISDNRYGLHHPKIKSVFITHQLLIKVPFKWLERLLQKLNYRFIEKFNECWVPDVPGKNNWAGMLSHPLQKPKIPVHFSGLLSRFNGKETVAEGNYLLILLSGPEPQRTLLENILLKDLKEYKGAVVFIRGMPLEKRPLEIGNNVTVFNHLKAEELAQKIRGANFVISRCGYSTIMDLAALKKKSILIPTPGQTEQEYLAAHLLKKNFALCVEQKKFRLKNVLELAAKFVYVLDTPVEKELIVKRIASLLDSARKKPIDLL